MGLCVPLVVLEVVYIIIIASAVHLHSLQENHKLPEIRLAIDAKDVREGNGTSTQVLQHHAEQVNHILEKGERAAIWANHTDQTHAEVLRELSIWRGKVIVADINFFERLRCPDQFLPFRRMLFLVKLKRAVHTIDLGRLRLTDFLNDISPLALRLLQHALLHLNDFDHFLTQAFLLILS